MSRNIAENSSERADAKLVVIRNGDVVLRRLVAGQADVAPGLPRRPIADSRGPRGP